MRYAIHCTNIQGSALYDASLGDEQLVEKMFAEAKAEQSAKVKKPTEKSDGLEHRPPRRGYSRVVEAIYDLTDNVVALRAEMGRWPPSQTTKAFVKRPWFPAEMVQEKMRKRARQNVNRAIATAQARWQEQHDDARVRS